MVQTFFYSVVCWIALLLPLVPIPSHSMTASQPGQSLSVRVYLNPNTGRFWTMDSHEGNQEDPLSLHKYLYCQGNSVNHVDPSGHDLGEVVFTMSMQTAMFAARIAPVINVARVAIATIAIAAFVADPEFRDIYIASGGNPAAAAEMLAADIRFASTSVFRSGAEVKNIITLRFNGGDANDFRVKTARLQRAANAGGLTVVSNPSGVRDPSAQANYRKAVFVRYTRYLQQLGMSEADATAQATKKFESLHADHKIDLQVSGALSDPNGSDNLQMLDGTVNMSVGSQLQKEIERLGLQTGDQIDQVDIFGP
jgi:RHS repeat-associated protein